MAVWSVLSLLRESPEELKRHVAKRLMDPALVDEAHRLDLEWRRLQVEVNEMRHEHNLITRSIPKATGEERARLMGEAKQVLEALKDLEAKLAEAEERRNNALLSLPNLVEEGVPIGDESASLPIEFWGRPKVWRGYVEQFKEQTERYGHKVDHEVIDWKPVGHADMLEEVLKLGNTLKAGEVAGSRFYYLFDDLVWMDFALLLFALDKLTSRGYRPVIPPYMLRYKVISGALDLPSFKDAIYKIEEEDLYLIATAEHSLAALYQGEEIYDDELPIRLVGISPCFRKEAGAGNKDLKGIFRVHQFHKVEQFVYAKPEESRQLHEEMTNNSREIFRELGLPYRVVNIASGDLGAPAVKKYDLEVWMPAQGKYREMVSASNVTDWQAFRLGIRMIRRRGMTREYVHMLNATALASTRTITAILENYQQPDGSVLIPRVLRKYLEPFAAAPKEVILPRGKRV